MKFTNFKKSRKCIFPIADVTHVRSRKTFYHVSAHFRNPGFRSVSKPRKPVFIFRIGPTTNNKVGKNSSALKNDPNGQTSGGGPVHVRVPIHAHPLISPKQSQLHNKLPMYMFNLVIIYVVVNIFSKKNYNSLGKVRVGVNWSTTTIY